MILYTPMQLELVIDGIEEMRPPSCREICIGGVQMLVEDVGSGSVRVVKLLSTDPGHYLLPDYKPGNIIDIYRLSQVKCDSG
ncbi:YlzJ-like family protein [Desulfocucumis palustris]|nr:YlzJ-like family protein [Desulfocucumis palustris]